MIQGKDLMKGNIVEYNGYYAVVHSVFGPYPNPDERFNNKECVDLIIGGMATVAIDEINPVVLTEEILLKCGFPWNIRFQANANEDYFFKLCECYPVEKGYNIVMKKDNFLLIPEVKYLHDFQNWFELTTKQELEIKL